MNLYHLYLQDAIIHLRSERFGPGLTALRHALLLRPQSPTAHRALLTCCFALGRSPDALYHGSLYGELASGEMPSLTALLARAGLAYADSLAGLGIAEAHPLHEGALERLRYACALSDGDPLLQALLHAEEAVPLTVASAGALPLHLQYHDPFLSWAGPANRRGYEMRLAERCRWEGHLVRYTSQDLGAGALHPAGRLQDPTEIASLPILQAWEITSPLGLESGRPLRTLSFIQPADGPLQILVEPWLDRLGAHREIRLAWDALAAFAA